MTNLKSLASHVLDQCKQRGASAAEVAADSELGFSATVRMGEVDTIEHNNGKSLTATVYFGQHSGSVSTSDFSDAAIATLVDKACNIAKFTQQDDCAGLAEKDLLAFDYPKLNLYHHWDINPDKAVELARQCESLARAQDKRIVNSEGATVDTHEYHQLYANSLGFIGEYATTRHSISCVLVAKQQDTMQRDYEYSTARDYRDLMSIEELASSAANKTTARLGAKSISTRNAPIIFRADVARQVLGNFVAAISGGNLYRKSSFLLDHIGKQVFPDFIQIDQQPHLPKAIGSVPFDSDGVKTTPQVIIKDGILQSYLLGVYSARKLAMQTTGNANGAHNLCIQSTSKSMKTLMKEMGQGLLVTELMGFGVNLVTGDYSQGASGFWIEGGEIQYPVQEITIASNLKHMFMNIVDVADDIDCRGNIRTGSLLISDMKIAGS